MKKILIVSYFFSPANIMGAVRGTKLAKYLERLGYEVTVICSENNNLVFMPNEVKKDDRLLGDIAKVNVLKVTHSSKYLKLAYKVREINKKKFPSGTIKELEKSVDYKVSRFINIKKKLIHFMAFMFSQIQDFDYYRQAKKSIKNNKLDSYDVVISTYGPLASHLVGGYIKKYNKSIRWIADFRDPMAISSQGKLQYLINKKIQNKICKKADKITAISNGNLEMITGGKYKEKSFVITNGYDKEDIEEFINSDVNCGKLKFVYTGTTYAGKRELSPIFKAIRELIDENKINVNNIQLNYAGTESSYVINQAKVFDLQEIIVDFGHVIRTKSLEIQAKSNLLVVSTWNDVGHTGVLPGKFLEYLALNKNIIGLVNGVESNSEIKKMINDYNLGVCYEAANKEEDFINLKEYILKKYIEVQEFKTCVFDGKLDCIKKHSYDYLAEEFLELLS